jgi:hypothetical protein
MDKVEDKNDLAINKKPFGKWFPWFRFEKDEDGTRWIIFGVTLEW